MEIKAENSGTAYIIKVQLDGRTLVGTASHTPRTGYFKVFIPGVCNLILFQDWPGHWSLDSGRPVVEELVQAIGASLFE